MIKYDGTQRGLIGGIIKKFEAKGYKPIAMKMMTPPISHWKKHYIEHKDLDFYQGFCEKMAEGPVIAMAWEGTDIIRQARAMLGQTQPLNMNVASVRGANCMAIRSLAMHASDSVESAKSELDLWFSPNEMITYDHSSTSWTHEL